MSKISSPCSLFRQYLLKLCMSFYIASLLFTVISSAALGIFVFIQGKQKAQSNLLAILAMIISLWCLFQIFGEISNDKNIVLLWTRMNIAAASFIPIIYIHFVLVFTKRLRRKNVFLLFLTYLLGLVFIILDFTPHFIADIAPRQEFKYYPIGGAAYPFFAVFIVSVALYALLQLFLSLRKSFGRKRNQIFYIILASIIGYAGAISAFAPAFNLNFPVLTPIAMPLYVALMVYAIVKHRLLDIRVVIRKGLIYSILTIFFTLIYGLSILLLNKFFEGLGAQSPILSTVVTVFLFIVLFQPLRDEVQKIIDRLFFKEKYIYQKTLKELSDAAVSILDPEELVRKVKETLKIKIKVEKVEIIKGEEEPQGFERVIPMLAKGKRVGSLCLGRKRSDEDYSDEDSDLLATLANQIAIALENASLYQELLRSDKFKALGVAAVGMAHEIKNPLASIKGLTQILPENINDPEFIEKYTDIIPRQLDRLNSILEELLRFGKPTKFATTDVDLKRVLDDVIEFQENQCSKNNIVIIREYGETPLIKADAQQLHQAFLNLILNAIEAMPNGGELKIQSAKLKDKVCIEFSDSGKGIPQKDLKNIFDPFFSTKENGTGMGLAVVYRIIKGHGGDIEAMSVEGKGTTFKIFL